MREWLKKLRENSGLSQQEVAEKLNISRQYYQQIEAGDRHQKMDITLVSKISDLFDVTISTIVKNEQDIRIITNERNG